MDSAELLEMFIDEAGEHLENLNQRVLELDKGEITEDTINEIFRAAHSLKGTSGSMGFTRLQRLTHDMESVFSLVREGKLSVGSDLVDLLFRCLDAVQAYLDNIRETSDEGTETNQDLIDELGKYLEGGAAAQPASKEQPVEKTPAPAEEAPEIKKELTNKDKVMKFEQFELDALKDAESEGQRSFLLNVNIDKSCLLKSVRAFMIFKKLEGKAEIIKLSPTSQDIEDENFDFDFAMVILTALDKESIEKRLSKVAEIESIEITPLLHEDIMKMNASVSSDEDVQNDKTESVSDAAAKPEVQEAGEVKPKAAPKVKKAVASHSVRVDIEKLDSLMNLVSELIIAKNTLMTSAGRVSERYKDSSNIRKYKQDIDYLDRITSNIHESVMRVRMVPIESVLSRFPRMVRDLSKKLGKNLVLEMSGEDTELDRTVIDEIGDPLMHMIRNSADHGIESPEERLKAGKPEVGTIRIDASQRGDNVIIEVSDDGSGIDTERVLKKAVESGKVSEEEAKIMSKDDIIGLLFKPSFSTAEKVSDVSGRGVGLDVVKSKIEGLGGDVSTESELGKGTKFIIRLPLTLAIIKALMIYVDQEIYAVPASSISIVEIMDKSEIQYIQDKPFVNLRGEIIPLIFLSEYFNHSEEESFVGAANRMIESEEDRLDRLRDSEEEGKFTFAVLRRNQKACGIVFNGYIGQQEIVVKPIGGYINPPKVISGSTILGNGDVALIIDPNALI